MRTLERGDGRTFADLNGLPMCFDPLTPHGVFQFVQHSEWIGNIEVSRAVIHVAPSSMCERAAKNLASAYRPEGIP